jgi:hypothetical protein
MIKVPDLSTKQPTASKLEFKPHKGMDQPRSLRNILISDHAGHSLSDQLRIAKQLAKSVSHIHAYRFVGKNIWPETIIVFKDRESSLGYSFPSWI